MRPTVPLVTTTSLTAGRRSPSTRASSVGSSSTRYSPASSSRRLSVGPIVSGLPCVTTATRRTRLPDCAIDPGLELIWPRRPPAVHEVEEELAVPLRAGQARVYDACGLGLPGERRLGDLADHAPVHGGVANHSALPDFLAAGLELRLDEDERLPARRSESEGGRKRETDADEGDVARDELRRERKLLERPRVRPLQHGHAGIGAEPLVELPVPDVERDHPAGAALEQDVREAAGRSSDVE